MRIARTLLAFPLLLLWAPAAAALYDLAAAWMAAPACGNPISCPAALGGGMLFWLILYFTLPRPTRSYILGHELTHALWAWMGGKKVRAIKLGRNGGSAAIEQPGILVMLAPYFFPFYAAMVTAVWGICALRFDTRPYQPFWLAAAGAAWGFHFTFTAQTLTRRQTDIERHGRLLSYAVVGLGNLLIISLWLIIIAPVSLELWGNSLLLRATAIRRLLPAGPG